MPQAGEQDRKDDSSDKGYQHLPGMYAEDHGHDEWRQCGLQQAGFFQNAQYQHDQSVRSAKYDTKTPEGEEEGSGQAGKGREGI